MVEESPSPRTAVEVSMRIAKLIYNLLWDTLILKYEMTNVIGGWSGWFVDSGHSPTKIVRVRIVSSPSKCEIVKIDNILRNIFFLPREYRQRNGKDTDEEVGMQDVYEEVDALMSRTRSPPCSVSL